MHNLLKLAMGLFMLIATAYPFIVDKQDEQPDIAAVPLSNTPDFASISDINERKKRFFEYMQAGIGIENQRIKAERAVLLAIQDSLGNNRLLTQSQQRRAAELASAYRVTGEIDQQWLSEMLSKVNVLPEGLVLVQAANESAWGTSRFARQANNFFGQWCYSEGCGIVPLQRVQGARHEVAKFSSAQGSINAYFMNVNRNKAYRELRALRSQLEQQGKSLTDTNAAMVLAHGLLRYSERGEAYVNDLQGMIRVNNKFWDKGADS